MTPLKALGLELDGQLEEDQRPYEVMCFVKFIDNEGNTGYHHLCTTGLTSVEALGMAVFTARKLEHGLVVAEDDEEDW